MFLRPVGSKPAELERWYRGTRDVFFIAAALNIGRKRGGAKGAGTCAPFFGLLVNGSRLLVNGYWFGVKKNAPKFGGFKV